MAFSDIPPPTAPPWLIPVTTSCLGLGVFFWLATYVLMVRRSLRDNATPMPMIALALNLSWEVVTLFYVTEDLIEVLGFGAWLVFDIPVLYATMKTSKQSFASQPIIARNFKLLLAIVFVYGIAANYWFAHWWLSEAHRGCGDKSGKFWQGQEGYDVTELSWWSASVAQMTFSVGALAMLLQRGHSGGTSYTIWLCRFIGTQMGLPITSLILWWYWPEAHEFISHPVSWIVNGAALTCDIAYPFVLSHVRSTERVLPDGTVVAGHDNVEATGGNKKKQ